MEKKEAWRTGTLPARHLSLCHSMDILKRKVLRNQGRIQYFGLGGALAGGLVWGTEVSQRGPGAQPWWGSMGEAPEARRMLRHEAKNHLWREKQVHTD